MLYMVHVVSQHGQWRGKFKYYMIESLNHPNMIICWRPHLKLLPTHILYMVPTRSLRSWKVLEFSLWSLRPGKVYIWTCWMSEIMQIVNRHGKCPFALLHHIYQSGTVPIWVTLSWLPKQVTLNMNFSQQLPKWITVSVYMVYEQLPKLWWLPVWVTVAWQLPKWVTLFHKHLTFWTLHAIRFLFMPSVFLRKKVHKDMILNKIALMVIF